jgi:hypothetical protein
MTPPTASTKWDHSSYTIGGTACTGCHTHEGSGSNHVDGLLQATAGGPCNTCHDYDTRAGVAQWGTGYGGGSGLNANVASWGAHRKHIDHLKLRYGITLDGTWNTFGGYQYNMVCGTCHTQNDTNHMNTTRQVNFNGSTARQFGASAPLWGTVSRSCSNLDCHYKATPQW